MKTRTIKADAYIENTPETVIRYISDVRNRPLYLRFLKAVSDVKGDTSVPGSTWRWKWVAFGMEFEGVGRCVGYEPGRQYAFRTEGGIDSTWTYRAGAERTGTNLTVDVEYDVPERALAKLPAETVLDSVTKSEANTAIQNLKSILDK